MTSSSTQISLFQDLQMIGDGCLRHVKVRGYVSGREPAGFQHLQYFAAYRVG